MKNMKKIILLIVMAILVLNISACSQGVEKEKKSQGIQVYTSIYPIYDFAKKVGGDRIQVELLVPPGAEPHGWEPSAKTVAKIEQSELFLYNGLEMDPWAEKLAISLGKEGVQTLAVGEIESIKPIKSNEDEHEHEDGEDEHGAYDPHVWLDPTIAQEMAKVIKDLLVEIDEENQEYYEGNFISFQQELEKLDQEYQQILSQVEKKEFIVAHAAFGYLARRYELQQIPISGISPQVEPSPSKLAELTALIKEHNINTIFFENLSSPKLAEVLAGETGANVEELNPLGGLTQEEIDSGKEYLSIMKENLKKLFNALS